MNKRKLYKEIGMVDDDLIEEAEYSKARIMRNHSFAKWISVAAIFCIFTSFVSTVFAVTYFQKSNLNAYIRYLSPDNINLLSNMSDSEIKYDADKFFEALKSDDIYYQYIAINRLVECFNDNQLREKAIKRIEPFIKSEEKKVADAASFVVDILSQKYESDKLYKLADGSVFFTLFNDYSDYGSYNELWRIKEGNLEKYFSFSNPSMYIKEIFLSPDRKLMAVNTCSNKSEYIFIIDAINGMVSPELIGSARTIFGAKKGYEVLVRIDNENYSSNSNVIWNNNQEINFDANLSYANTEIIEDVSVKYNFDKKLFEIEPNK